jgi:hypothetical protein
MVPVPPGRLRLRPQCCLGPPNHDGYFAALCPRSRHSLDTLCFLALLVTGVEIVISHPRFHWGETGNDLTPALFKLPIPASRALVSTGYGYILPDQNGWSRSFQAALSLGS